MNKMFDDAYAMSLDSLKTEIDAAYTTLSAITSSEFDDVERYYQQLINVYEDVYKERHSDD